MRKLIFCTLALVVLSTTKNYAQSLYKREWGTLLPIITETTKPFTAEKKIVRTSAFVVEVNNKNNNLYLVNAYGNEIYEYRPNELKPKLIYKIPENQHGLTVIEHLKFDAENNLIISGRTVVEKLATANAYSENLIFGLRLAPSFVSKIDLQGNVIWLTYFHDIPSTASPLAIDAENNIYVLNKRNKNTVASPSFFQKNGDMDSSAEYQDVISKIDKNGKHIWSTFYTKDSSNIKSIVAGKNGLYVYGDHLGATMSSNYFGTPNSHLPTISRPHTSLKNVYGVFLSKFSFKGERLWSTYVGEQNTNVPLGNTLLNSSCLAVINDEAYILATHRIYSTKNLNIATEKAYLKEPFSLSNTKTVSKFSSNGEKLWTSFVHTGEHLFTNGEELFISSLATNQEEDSTLPAVNAYQPKFGGGNSDVYTSVVSLDGTTLEYASFYGYDGRDAGVTLPTKNGFYIIGTTDINQKEKAPFATSRASENKYTQKGDVYIGDFLSYFTKKGKKTKQKTKKNDL